jgi:hypothetical protein
VGVVVWLLFLLGFGFVWGGVVFVFLGGLVWGDQAFISADHPSGLNRPTIVRFGPDDCAYVADYGAVRDNGEDTHFVGAGNGPLLQIPATGVIWKICRQ